VRPARSFAAEKDVVVTKLRGAKRDQVFRVSWLEDLRRVRAVKINEASSRPSSRAPGAEQGGAAVKIFLDTSNVAQTPIRGGPPAGAFSHGVTTNPTLVAREKRPFHEAVREICGIVDGPVSAETVSLEAAAIVAEGRLLAKIHDRIVVKWPVMKEGSPRPRALAAEGIKVNMTLVFSRRRPCSRPGGAAYISPFVGRLDDAGHPGHG